MHLFRRRLGLRTAVETPAASVTSRDKAKTIKRVSGDNSPPSYEDSQDASLRAVLHDAEKITPLLWHSVLPPPSPLTLPLSSRADQYRDVPLDMNPALSKNDEKAENLGAGTSTKETAMIDVLANLATTPCGEHPFLSRIREFSDLYFAPYAVVDETPAIPAQRSPGPAPGPAPGPCSTSPTFTSPSPQAQQRKALETIPACRESVALVLCARLLEAYYAGLGHTTIDAEGNVTRKTRLAQLAACAEPSCACGDYDEAAAATSFPSPLSETKTATDSDVNALPTRTRRCACGHARPSHAAAGAAMAMARLVRRYTNWRSESYASLCHRSSSGRPKHRVSEIEVCGASCAPLLPCPCRDYDKGRRTGRCARCGHYAEAHVPIHAARGQRSEEKGRSERGRKDDGPSTMGAADPGQRDAEWDLSWILIENAYLLLGQITASSHGEKLSVSSSL